MNEKKPQRLPEVKNKKILNMQFSMLINDQSI